MNILKLLLNYLIIILFLCVGVFCFYVDYTYYYHGGMCILGMVIILCALVISIDRAIDN